MNNRRMATAPHYHRTAQRDRIAGIAITAFMAGSFLGATVVAAFIGG